MTVLVCMAHARQIKRRGGRPLCESGIRAWCDRNAIDWKAFTGPGVDVERFDAIGDHYAQTVAAIARGEPHGR